VQIKHTPTQFCWKSARDGAGKERDEEGAKMSKELEVDPDRIGFGKNPMKPWMKTPALC
jgi:hypothetical protein